MARSILISAAMMAIFCTQSLAQDKPISDDSLGPPQNIKMKSKSLGVFFAVVPGSIIHGMGHIYAGDYGAAAGLFIAEIFGATFAVGGAAGAALSSWGGGDCGECVAMAIGGIILFAGSWIYDIAATPSAVQRYNDRQWHKHIIISIKPDQINHEKTWLLGLSLKF